MRETILMVTPVGPDSLHAVLPPGGIIPGMTRNLWPVVALVAVIVAGVLTASALHIDVNAVTALLPVLVAAVGYVIQQLGTIRHQTNGNVSALLDEIAEMRKALANSIPVSAVPQAQLPAGPGGPDGPVVLDCTPDGE